jgi:hypothetical protein
MPKHGEERHRCGGQRNFNVPEGMNPDEHSLVTIGQVAMGTDVRLSIEVCGVQHNGGEINGQSDCSLMAVVPVWTDPNEVGEPGTPEWLEAVTNRAAQVTTTLSLWGTDPFKSTMTKIAQAIVGLVESSSFEGALELGKAEAPGLTAETLHELRNTMDKYAREKATEAMSEATEEVFKESPAQTIERIFGEDMTDNLKHT